MQKDKVYQDNYDRLYILLDKRTIERELAPLQEIKDNYHKTLLTLDEIGNRANYDGIKQVNVIDWLLNRQKKIYNEILRFHHYRQ